MAYGILNNVVKKDLLLYYFCRTDMPDTSRPSTFYLGLSSTAPLADGTGITEPAINTTTGYARVPIAASSASFNTPASGNSWNVTNANTVEFPEVKVDLGTVSYFFLSTAATGGTIVAGGALASNRVLQALSTISIAAGDLRFTFLNQAA